MKKRVVVLGKGVLAIKIAAWFLKSEDYELICVVPQIPEPTWSKSFSNWATKNKLRVIKSGDYRELQKTKINIDLVVSVFYDKIVKRDLISRVKKIINIHNSPLPKYRGVKPVHWALKNNESFHGVTIHEIAEGIDDGPIISQVTFSIYPVFEEVIDVYKRSLKYGYLLFLQTIPNIWKIKAKTQDESLATYYSSKENNILGERLSVSRKLDKRKTNAQQIQS